MGDAIGSDFSKIPENKGKHNRRNNGLDKKPDRSQKSLFI